MTDDNVKRQHPQNNKDSNNHGDNNNNSEDDDDREVRALAAALAPQMEELETLLESPIHQEKQQSDKHEDDDDGLKSELSGLENSEYLLRQELEFAQDFGHLLSSSPQQQPLFVGLDPPETAIPSQEPMFETPMPSNELLVATPTTASAAEEEESFAMSSYTLAHHARRLKLRGGWYSYPLVFEKENPQQDFFAREYIVSIQFTELKKLLTGLVDPPSLKRESLQRPQQQPQSPLVAPSSPPLPQHPHRDSLLDEDASISSNEDNYLEEEELMLPVRTVTIRIRPDVLCGAVMDAVHHAVTELDGEVTKRQGGHLKGIIGPTRVVTYHEVKYDDLPDRWSIPQPPQQDEEETKSTDSSSCFELPAFAMDVQLCTYKGTADHNGCERTLILRTYPVSKNVYRDIGVPPMTQSDPLDLSANTRLREAAALVQRIESQGSSTPLFSSRKGPSTAASLVQALSPLKLFTPSPRNQHDSNNNSETTNQEEIITKELFHHVRPCPSVVHVARGGGSKNNNNNMTLPALSKDDWPVVQSSWRIVAAIWNQLETLDLAYMCLSTCQFGAFPALPTLDVHYCSQMRRYCRETMVVSLLKTASELEQYARESEYSCASLVQNLKSMFEYYGIEPPALPQPVPLTAYPLDFTPPQVACPPWGIKVMEALNQVAAKTSDANKMLVSCTTDESTPTKTSSFDAAEEAVRMVLAAFQRQDDEEQGARLGRKNVQVMDRLAKMQAHKRASIDAIALSMCSKAVKAAEEFATKALQAVSRRRTDSNADEADASSPDFHEVPLFWCSILGGGTTTGTCYVTARHLLLVTHLLPLVGGPKCTLFDLTEIELELYQPPRLMNTIVAPGITVFNKNDREQEHSFRPSLGAKRFQKFVNIIREAAMESPNKLKFSERGGLLYLYGDEATGTGGKKDTKMPSLMDRDENEGDQAEEVTPVSRSLVDQDKETDESKPIVVQDEKEDPKESGPLKRTADKDEGDPPEETKPLEPSSPHAEATMRSLLDQDEEDDECDEIEAPDPPETSTQTLVELDVDQEVEDNVDAPTTATATGTIESLEDAQQDPETKA